MTVEVQCPKGLGDLVRLEVGKRQPVQIELEVEVAHDGCDLAREKREVLVVAHLLELLALEVVEMLIEPLDAAVLLQELGRRLGADARHAGYVVGAVAHEPEVVGNLLRRDAVLFLDAGWVVDDNVGDALFRVDDRGELACQLAGILIARDEKRPVPTGLVARRHGTEDVVAFPARHLDHGNVHGLKQRLHERELHAQGLVHGRTLRLVLLHGVDAELGLSGVERAHDTIRVRDLDELEQHGHEAERRVGGRTVGRVHGRLNGMVGAVHERVSVDDGDFAIGHKERPSETIK